MSCWHTCSTQSFSGILTVWLPSSETTQAGVSGVASISASTASAPIRQPYHITGIQFRWFQISYATKFSTWWPLSTPDEIPQLFQQGRQRFRCLTLIKNRPGSHWASRIYNNKLCLPLYSVTAAECHEKAESETIKVFKGDVKACNFKQSF